MAEPSLEELVACCHREEEGFCVQRLGGMKRMCGKECVDLHVPVVMPWTVSMVIWHGMKEEGMRISCGKDVGVEGPKKTNFVT